MESASGTLKRVTLELGGNDAAIVLPDADIDHVVPQLFWSAFTNSGQVCLASKRIYIHRQCYDAFAEKFVAYARSVKVGSGLAPDSLMGPLQNRRQYLQVKALIERAKAQGLKLLFEGDIPSGPGYFVPVTIFGSLGESVGSFWRFSIRRSCFSTDQISRPPWTRHLPTGQACGQPLRGA